MSLIAQRLWDSACGGDSCDGYSCISPRKTKPVVVAEIECANILIVCRKQGVRDVLIA